MKVLIWTLMALLALSLPAVVLAGGGANGFDGVVGSIEHRYSRHATRMPFRALVSLIAGRTSHGGVAGLRVAEFEHFGGAVDSEELNSMVAERLGPGWERIVRESSRQGAEQTLIFGHPEGERMGLFVLDLDGEQLDVVQLSVDSGHLSESLVRYRHGRQSN